MSLNTNSPNQMGQSSNNAGHDGTNAANGQEEAWTGQHQTRNTTVPKFIPLENVHMKCELSGTHKNSQITNAEGITATEVTTFFKKDLRFISGIGTVGQQSGWQNLKRNVHSTVLLVLALALLLCILLILAYDAFWRNPSTKDCTCEGAKGKDGFD